jgi:hypothetical protein
MDAMPSKVESLLGRVEGLQLVPLDRPDECCGFGGTFAVQEVGVSILMGKDRLADHAKQGAEVITATDVLAIQFPFFMSLRSSPVARCPRRRTLQRCGSNKSR